MRSENAVLQSSIVSVRECIGGQRVCVHWRYVDVEMVNSVLIMLSSVSIVWFIHLYIYQHALGKTSSYTSFSDVTPFKGFELVCRTKFLAIFCSHKIPRHNYFVRINFWAIFCSHKFLAIYCAHKFPSHILFSYTAMALTLISTVLRL